MPLAPLSTSFQSLPLPPTIKLGLSGAASRVGRFVYILGPCVSPRNSPVRLGVSPTSVPTGVFNQWFEALFPHAGALGCVVCHLVHQLLPCWPAAALLTLLHNPPLWWVCQLLSCCESSPTGCQSPPLLPVWMNVSSLSPWLSDFHTLQFSVSSGDFFCIYIVVVLLLVV